MAINSERRAGNCAGTQRIHIGEPESGIQPLQVAEKHTDVCCCPEPEADWLGMLHVRVARHHCIGMIRRNFQKRTAKLRQSGLCSENLFADIEMCVNQHLIVAGTRRVKFSAVLNAGAVDKVRFHIHVDIFLFGF